VNAEAVLVDAPRLIVVVIACHTLWLFGIRYLTLDYAMRRADAS